MKIKDFSYRVSLSILFVGLLFSPSVWAQSPDKMSYQAIVRDSNGILVSDTQVGMKISILQGSENGPVVYTETQAPFTNSNGLVSIAIGNGTGFNTINWANGVYFIKSETDPNGGSNYSISGTSQLLSVPYALHAKSSEGQAPGTAPGEMLYWNGSQWAIVQAGNEGGVLTFIDNKPTWVGGTPAPINTVLNPVTGKTWMDRNLGASQVATSIDDAAS